jgi:hypothetical protein
MIATYLLHTLFQLRIKVAINRRNNSKTASEREGGGGVISPSV